MTCCWPFCGMPSSIHQPMSEAQQLKCLKWVASESHNIPAVFFFHVPHCGMTKNLRGLMQSSLCRCDFCGRPPPSLPPRQPISQTITSVWRNWQNILTEVQKYFPLLCSAHVTSSRIIIVRGWGLWTRGCVTFRSPLDVSFSRVGCVQNWHQSWTSELSISFSCWWKEWTMVWCPLEWCPLLSPSPTIQKCESSSAFHNLRAFVKSRVIICMNFCDKCVSLQWHMLQLCIRGTVNCDCVPRLHDEATNCGDETSWLVITNIARSRPDELRNIMDVFCSSVRIATVPAFGLIMESVSQREVSGWLCVLCSEFCVLWK